MHSPQGGSRERRCRQRGLARLGDPDQIADMIVFPDRAWRSATEQGKPEILMG